MKLITQRDMIRNVAKAWREQYPTDRDLMIYQGDGKGACESSDEIARRLEALDGDTATPADVAKAINAGAYGGWTQITCHECNRDELTIAVILGRSDEAMDGCEHPFCICFECLLNAAKLEPMP